MFSDFPKRIYLRGYRVQGLQNGTSGAWGLLMAPGVGLIGAALALLLWPELLAYVVASLLFCVGIMLTGWGWQLWRAERSVRHGGYSPRARGPSVPDDWAS